jgi:hypothetical protein
LEGEHRNMNEGAFDKCHALRSAAWALSAGHKKRKPCHWIRNSTDFGGVDFDDATNFCRPCAIKALRIMRRMAPKRFAEAEPAIDGGWCTDHDSLPYCHSCGYTLDGSFTDWGAREELAHFEHYPPDIDDCESWFAFSDALETLTYDSPLWPKVEAFMTATARNWLLRVLSAHATAQEAGEI